MTNKNDLTQLTYCICKEYFYEDSRGNYRSHECKISIEITPETLVDWFFRSHDGNLSPTEYAIAVQAFVESWDYFVGCITDDELFITWLVDLHEDELQQQIPHECC